MELRRRLLGHHIIPRYRERAVTEPPPPSPSVAVPPVQPLTQRERFRLMLRFNLTSTQVERLPSDIARTLLGLR